MLNFEPVKKEEHVSVGQVNYIAAPNIRFPIRKSQPFDAFGVLHLQLA